MSASRLRLNQLCNHWPGSLALILAISLAGTNALAVGESSTRFNTFVPAWNDSNNRWVGFYITASGDGADGYTTVDVWDMPADNCARNACDPYGVLQSGADGAVASGVFSSPSGNFVEPTGAINYPYHRYIVIRDLANPELDEAYRIIDWLDANSVELDPPAPNGGALDWVYVQPGDIDDSYPGVRLKRGETLGIFMKDSNRCITSIDSAECVDFNADNPRTPLAKDALIDFFKKLNPTPLQLSALRASLVTYPVPAIVDDRSLVDGDTFSDPEHFRDGDYFLVQADAPVTSYVSNKSNWLHDVAVSDTKNSMGQNFYIFAAPTETPNTDLAGTNGQRDIDIFAYENDTWVTIYRIGAQDESINTACPTCMCDSNSGCKTQIAEVDWAAAELLTFPRQSGAPERYGYDHFELDAGQSLNLWNRTIAAYETLHNGNRAMRDQGITRLSEGHTYYITATKPVTVMYGELQFRGRDSSKSARDGGGMVPSQNGTSSGELFYFTIPTDRCSPPRCDPDEETCTGEYCLPEPEPCPNIFCDREKELRMVSFDNDNTVCLDGFDTDLQEWLPIPFDGQSALNPCQTLQSNQRIDLIGHGKGQDHPFRTLHLLRLRCSPGRKITVAQANWMETGGQSTSDMASFVSPQNLESEGSSTVRFLIYTPPPSAQGNIRGVEGIFSHVFIFGERNNTQAFLRPTDVNGGAVPVACQNEFPDTGFTRRNITINRDGYFDFRMGTGCYNALNNPPSSRPYLELIANSNVSVLISNYNDNWLNYNSSLLPATPSMSMRVDQPLVSISENSDGDVVFAGSTGVTLFTRHLFPVLRLDPIMNATIEIAIPDGLALVGTPTLSGLSAGTSLNIDVNDTLPHGITKITINGFNHAPFTTLAVQLPIQVLAEYSTGADVADGSEAQLNILAQERGTVAGTLMAGYTSTALRIFRCTQGHPIQDPDGDGLCSGTGACHTVAGTEICAGADTCPHHYSADGSCPANYICEPWGVCYADPEIPPCSPGNLSGSCAVGPGDFDPGYSCTPAGCVAYTDDACESGGSLCPVGGACVNGACLPIDANNPGCTWEADSYGLCNNGYTCIDGTCVQSPGPSCADDPFGFCAHGWQCVSAVCIPIDMGERCENGGPSCPHGMACIDDVCSIIAPEDSCGSAQGSFCPGSAACIDGLCVDAESDACALGGSICPHAEACVAGVCLEPGTGTACGAGGNLCPHSQACVDDACESIGPGEACTDGNGHCAHGAACVQGVCVSIGVDAACSTSNLEGLCPHHRVCLEGACADITTDNACGCEHSTGLCPQTFTCVCAASDACDASNCGCEPNDVLCSPTHASGLCPAEMNCVLGECLFWCSLTKPAGHCPLPGDVCTEGVCQATLPADDDDGPLPGEDDGEEPVLDDDDGNVPIVEDEHGGIEDDGDDTPTPGSHVTGGCGCHGSAPGGDGLVLMSIVFAWGWRRRRLCRAGHSSVR